MKRDKPQVHLKRCRKDISINPTSTTDYKNASEPADITHEGTHQSVLLIHFTVKHPTFFCFQTLVVSEGTPSQTLIIYTTP